MGKYAQRIAEIQDLAAAVPGLHLAGNAYSGIGIPDCVRTGKHAAEKILQWGGPMAYRVPSRS